MCFEASVYFNLLKYFLIEKPEIEMVGGLVEFINCWKLIDMDILYVNNKICSEIET